MPLSRSSGPRTVRDRWHATVAVALILVLAILWWAGRGPAPAGCCGTEATAVVTPQVAALPPDKPMAPTPTPGTDKPATPTPSPDTDKRAPSPGTAEPTPSVPSPPPAPRSELALTNRDGKVLISGVARDETARKALLAQAERAFGSGNVVDRLRLDPNADAPGWLAKLDDLLAWLAREDGNSLRVAGSSVTLAGTAASAQERAARSDLARKVFGATAGIDNQIKIAAERPALPPVTAPLPPAMARVYFGLDQAALPADAGRVLAPIIAYLKSHPGATVALSGYHDPTGTKAYNERLADNRARSVGEALRAAGITPDRIIFDKPAETTGSGEHQEARRVEVTVRP